MIAKVLKFIEQANQHHSKKLKELQETYLWAEGLERKVLRFRIIELEYQLNKMMMGFWLSLHRIIKWWLNGNNTWSNK